MFQSIGRVIESQKTNQAVTLEAAMVVARSTECSSGRWSAVQFRRGRLTIVAPSAIEAQELVLRKQSVLECINQALGQKAVTKLCIRS